MALWKAARGQAQDGEQAAMREEPGSWPETQRTRGARAIRALLGLSLLRKIVVANAVVVAATAVVAAVVGSHLSAESGLRAQLAPALLVLGAGVLFTIALNAAIISLALRPLRMLQDTALRIQNGDLEARAAVSPLADADLARLVRTFNEVLDRTAVYRQRLRDIAARAQSAAEDERKRIARELHDGTAQTLAAMRVRLRLARGIQDADLREQQLDQISTEIGEAIEELRRIARGLRPPSLDMLGLGTAVDSYARPLADAAGLDVDLRIGPVAGLLSPEAELALYRVMQESLSNVVRHSGAATVRIALRRAGGTVELRIEDDGRGFRFDDVLDGDGRGLGLFGMQERAGYVGGHVDIESDPGRGTRVIARMPITEAAKYA